MDLHDRAFDRELAALLFEQPRALHQLALVELPLRLGGVEQGERRQGVVALAALGRRLRDRLGVRHRQGRHRNLRLGGVRLQADVCRTRLETG